MGNVAQREITSTTIVAVRLTTAERKKLTDYAIANRRNLSQQIRVYIDGLPAVAGEGDAEVIIHS